MTGPGTWTRPGPQHLACQVGLYRVVRGPGTGVRVPGPAAGLAGEDLAASLGEALAAGRQRNIIRSEPRGQT